MLASWPLYIIFAIFPAVILGIFGPRYTSGAAALAVLSLAMLVNLGTGNVTVVLLMGGKSSWSAINAGAALIVNIGLNLVLVPRIGILGAAIAWGASIVVDNVTAMIEVRWVLGIAPFGPGYGLAVMTTMGCFGFTGVRPDVCWARHCLRWPPRSPSDWRRTGRPCILPGVRFNSPEYLRRCVPEPGPSRARPKDRIQQQTTEIRQPDRRDKEGLMPQQVRGPVNQAARAAAKQVLRRYGEVTSGFRPGPDFVIIGAKRGGTTSLYNYVLEHSSIRPLFPGRMHLKGVHYYDSNYDRGLRWYRSHFPLRVGGRYLVQPGISPAITGEASPYYLFHPLAAERLAADFPDVRLIVLLRDPVERAYSHFKERTHHGGETLGFEEALDCRGEPAARRGRAHCGRAGLPQRGA